MSDAELPEVTTKTEHDELDSSHNVGTAIASQMSVSDCAEMSDNTKYDSKDVMGTESLITEPDTAMSECDIVEYYGIKSTKRVKMLPMDKLKATIETYKRGYRRKRSELSNYNGYCSESLLDLKFRSDPDYYRRTPNWSFFLNKAIRNAVFSHNWDTLLNLLIRNPIYDYHGERKSHVMDNYKRAIIILLLNHPDAKNKSSLLEFLHLALSCRTEEDQKALLKVLLALPKKLPKRSHKLQFDGE